MSSDFTKVLVKDDRMECVDNIKYMVLKGGQNVTPSQFGAISKSNNQIVFNIQVPSEQTLIDRRVLLQTDLKLVVTSGAFTYAGATSNAAPLAPVNGCGYGLVSSLASYPLHSLMTVASATINNNTVSVNMRDVLPAIIRLLDKKELGSYNGMSATATDSLLNYSDTTFGDSPSCGSAGILDTDFVGRGSIQLIDYTIAAGAAGFSVETFTWRLSEALMISPFIYCNPKSNGQAFYGIQNMNVVLNIGSDLKRVFRGLGLPNNISVPAGTYAATTYNPSPAGQATTSGQISLPYISSVAAGTFAGSSCMFDQTYLLFTFITAHPSDLFPARNICPYYELPRYISATTAPAPVIPTPITGTTNTALVASGTTGGAVWTNTTGGTVFASQTLQLNQIPDKLILYMRKSGASQSYADSDSYLPIQAISIDFNNNSGILSAARSEDLYRMAKDNGSNQSWSEWQGYQMSSVTVSQSGLSYPSALGTGTITAPAFRAIPTCGSVVVLEFAKDIQLIEDFFSCGSLGNFNIRVNVTYKNNNPSLTAGSAIELVMITMNSGVFVCERGTSSTYTGILTRADVLEASAQDAYTRSDVKRMVGGGFLDLIKSGVSKLAPLHKAVKAADMGQTEGRGMSGGGGSGGRLSGRYH